MAKCFPQCQGGDDRYMNTCHVDPLKRAGIVVINGPIAVGIAGQHLRQITTFQDIHSLVAGRVTGHHDDFISPVTIQIRNDRISHRQVRAVRPLHRQIVVQYVQTVASRYNDLQRTRRR